MVIVCAWCQARQGEKEPLDSDDVTHGLCIKCCENMMVEFKNYSELKNNDIDLSCEKIISDIKVEI